MYHHMPIGKQDAHESLSHIPVFYTPLISDPILLYILSQNDREITHIVSPNTRQDEQELLSPNWMGWTKLM